MLANVIQYDFLKVEHNSLHMIGMHGGLCIISQDVFLTSSLLFISYKYMVTDETSKFEK